METSGNNNIKRKTVSGLMWSFFERFGAQGVTFIVSIVLARLLDPAVYGTIAIVTVVLEILDVFVDSGLGNALIQKTDADDTDFSSVFFFNLVASTVMYGVLFFTAPLVAKFFDTAELTALIRVMGLSLVFSGVKNVQKAYVARQMCFKRFFYATTGGTIGAAVLGILMAYKGFGVWALVAQSLFNNCLDTLILWVTVKWRPALKFSLRRFMELFAFGWKILTASIVNSVYNNLRQLIIGKLYTTSSLAFYNRGYMVPNVFVSNVNSAIDNVLFPVMSSAQNNVETVKAMTRRSVRVSSYVMWPVMLGIAACASPLVSLLLTDKWLPCVPFVIVFSISYAFNTPQSANLNAIKAMGHSDIYLRVEITKKIIGLAVLIATMWFGPLVMALGNLGFTVICIFVNAFPNRKLLNYSYRQQMADFLPSMLLAGAMFAIVYSLKFLGLTNWLTLLIQVPTGVLIYLIGSKLFKFDSFDYILNTLKSLSKNAK